VFARHRQRGDVHGDAAVHVERPDEEETPASHDGSAGARGLQRDMDIYTYMYIYIHIYIYIYIHTHTQIYIY